MVLSQQEKGHGGGGAIISSELDWAGLGERDIGGQAREMGG